jgi:hypothetical protein
MKKSKKPAQTKRPKGSYPLPTGGYVVRRGSITSIRRDPPDMSKLAEAFLYLAEQLRASESRDSDGN